MPATKALKTNRYQPSDPGLAGADNRHAYFWPSGLAADVRNRFWPSRRAGNAPVGAIPRLRHPICRAAPCRNPHGAAGLPRPVRRREWAGADTPSVIRWGQPPHDSTNLGTPETFSADSQAGCTEHPIRPLTSSGQKSLDLARGPARDHRPAQPSGPGPHRAAPTPVARGCQSNA